MRASGWLALRAGRYQPDLGGAAKEHAAAVTRAFPADAWSALAASTHARSTGTEAIGPGAARADARCTVAARAVPSCASAVPANSAHARTAGTGTVDPGAVPALPPYAWAEVAVTTHAHAYAGSPAMDALAIVLASLLARPYTP